MIQAVIIDDEKKVRQVLNSLLQKYCNEVEVIGEAGSVEEGYRLICSLQPQLVFLDIEMPDGDGFELLQRFEKIQFETIFVTSYSNYSIRAIRFSAFDYLLKPVIVEELKAAIMRLNDKLNSVTNLQAKYNKLQENLSRNNDPQELVINNRNRFETVNIDQILYLQADSNYTYIFTSTEKRFHVSKTLKEYEEILCANNNMFLRVHKKYIVNVNYLQYIDRGELSKVILNNGVEIDLSRRKKAELIQRLSHKRKSIIQ